MIERMLEDMPRTAAVAPTGGAFAPVSTGPEPVTPGRFALVSVVIPARNEAQNLPILVEEIAAALEGRAFEVVVIDDGSTDGTREAILALQAAGRPVRHIRHDRSCGQSRAVRTGALVAHGDVVVTIDGDGQNDPRFIPGLVALLEEGPPGTALAAGQRTGRTDTRLKQFSSAFANGLRARILKDATRDTGCGLKAVPTAVFRRLPYFEGWHRYLPALVMREGLGIAHLDVVDRERRFGTSNYGIFDRMLVGILDLFGVWWLLRRGQRRPEIREL
ncbi:dolichol-phosphate mannosyltransferase [Aureimonas endophytica]|uniref:Dolichol-phosphate mannosyltransferase n=1 Tax=Aureimonas endophytica TaxID=2027858 RepID=A0A916ZGJ3_9HYPH|nr:glycosyltransferase family 2 protein [Aureimonas endophytica]GGD96413.1 dolichol-phosphate mannosyltransferase [Aureimonas endophytica]